MTHIVDIIEDRSFQRTDEVGCPLCGAPRQPRRIKVSFGMIAMVAECQECRVAFQTPRPSPEASQAYMNWRWRSSDAYVADKSNQLGRALSQIDLVMSFVQKPQKLLDFGAGAGSFVRAALGKGWDATGIEQSESARQRAKKFYDVELTDELRDGLYDVVTLWDVIEHLREPVLILEEIRDHLVPGGAVFVETGNYENWTRVVEKDKWSLYLFDHQFYFSPSSLERIVSAAGYVDFRLLDVNHVYPWRQRSLIWQPAAFAAGMAQWFRARRKWGMHGDVNVMVAIARKPEDPGGSSL